MVCFLVGLIIKTRNIEKSNIGWKKYGEVAQVFLLLMRIYSQVNEQAVNEQSLSGLNLTALISHFLIYALIGGCLDILRLI